MATGRVHRRDKRWRLLVRVAGLVILIVSANLASAWLVDILNLELTPRNEQMVHEIIMISVIAYAFLIAIPFVPGVEIGLALLIIVGPGVSALVYLATVLGLFLSFLAGQFVPQSWLKSILEFFYLSRASRLISRVEDLGTDERLAFLASRAPSRMVPTLLRYRYLALAVALNVPGNALIGGGGGISMMAGLSRLYSTPAFLLTLALAVSPVPVAVLLFGQEVLAR